MNIKFTIDPHGAELQSLRLGEREYLWQGDPAYWPDRALNLFPYIGRMTGKVTALNNDKYNILKQRNWRCDIQPAIDELGYQPTVKLEQGVKETIQWYKEHGWL